MASAVPFCVMAFTCRKSLTPVRFTVYSKRRARMRKYWSVSRQKQMDNAEAQCAKGLFTEMGKRHENIYHPARTDDVEQRTSAAGKKRY